MTPTITTAAEIARWLLRNPGATLNAHGWLGAIRWSVSTDEIPGYATASNTAQAAIRKAERELKRRTR